MSLTYKKDIYGKEILLDTNGGQVMMEWEKQYMEACIDTLEPQGNVLEIGFGMGYSASRILSHEPNSYTIVECDDNVIERIKVWKKDYPNQKVIIVKGQWQDLLPTIGKFDAIFFDDFPNDRELPTITDRNRIKFFLHNMLTYNAKIGTKISFYCQALFASLDPCINLSSSIFNCVIPKNCKYCQGQTLYLIVLTKIKEISPTNSFITEYNFWKNNAKIVLQKIYRQKVGIITIDSVLDNPMKYRQHALNLPYIKKDDSFQAKTSLSKEILQKIKTCIPASLLPDALEYETHFKYYTANNSLAINGTSKRLCIALFLTPHAPIQSGIKFYVFNDNTRYKEEGEEFQGLNLPRFTKDITKWHEVDSIGNIFNRMVYFDPKHYHRLSNLFGDNKTNGLLIQWIYFK